MTGATVKVELDFSRCVLPPYPHQRDGVAHLVRRQSAALFDEMGVGKTKQVIDAQQFLFEHGLVDAVVVLAPASVRGVWDDPCLGEIAQHSWVPRRVFRYDSTHGFPCAPEPGKLDWIVASYAFVRQRDDLEYLLRCLGRRRFTLVLDESSMVKSHKAQQTKAARAVARRATRRVILNGTPVSNNLLDLWAQFDVLDPAALDMSFYQFRARHCVMGGYLDKQVLSYRGAKEVKAKLAPYILRREKRDVLDLPPVAGTHREVPLGAEAWRLYKQMRDDMVAWLDSATPATASQAAVRVTRLSQLTSGFLGGLDEGPPVAVDDAKLRAWLEWRETIPGPAIAWCRFRAEIERLVEASRAAGRRCEPIWGGQTDSARQRVINAFQAGELDDVVGQPAAGGLGLTLTAACVAAYLSNDYSLTSRLQSEARIDRPGQTRSMSVVDFVAVSPGGKRTVDHAVLGALRQKRELARWTTADWKRALEG